jgi:hypothetical protein
MGEVEPEDVLAESWLVDGERPGLERADDQGLAECRHRDVVRAFRVECKERWAECARVEIHRRGVYLQVVAGSWQLSTQ